jgi:hypothetical protein
MVEKAEVKAGRIVVREGIIGAFRVEKVSANGETADIQQFDVRKQERVGLLYRHVPIAELSVFEQDAG